MTKKLLPLFLLILSLAVFGQEKQYTTRNREAIKLYSRAKNSINYQLYDQAIEELEEAIKNDPNFLEAHNQLADILRMKKEYKKAVEHYTKVITVNADFNRGLYYNLGEAELNIGNYEDAQNHLKKYLTNKIIGTDRKQYTELLISHCVFAIEALKHPVAFKPVNMGPEINTKNDEYLPVLTADESLLIFTRKINQNEDFYKSSKVMGKWQNALYLSDKINTRNYNEGAQSVTQDGRFLFFTGCDRPDGLGQCDIYVAKKNGSDWDKPTNLGAPVNSHSWESQPSISADGKTLYFVSNRKGGYGGYDIWKSNYTDKGWSEPENLGPNINTKYDEQSPFIHADDSTLYFSSNGWPGMGNLDLFVSRKDAEGKWQKPVNLGYPINTSGDDSGLTLNANGNDAYFSSDNLKGYGGYDIYTFEMPDESRPKLVTYTKGSVKDSKTRAPLEAAVVITDLETEKPVFTSYSSPEDGFFFSTITSGKNYSLHISKKGYLFYSANFSLEGYNPSKQFLIDVRLQRIEIGNKVVLNNIFFETGKFDIKEESKVELQKLIDFLNDNPTVKIEVSGHTDNVGLAATNQVLSQTRAKAVYDYLVSQKVPPGRLTYKGYGKLQPVAVNTTEDGRLHNRRTEFKVIAK